MLWDFAYLGYPGWRNDLVKIIAVAALEALALIGWSWTAGFLLARVSRRSVWLTGALFCFALFAGTLGTTTTARFYNGAFSIHFVSVVFPRLVRTCLVLLPALAGARRALRTDQLSALGTIITAVGIVLVTVAMSASLENSLTFGRLIMPNPGPDAITGTIDDPRPLWPLSLVMLWPTMYIVAMTVRQRMRAGVST
jgi:hypothetical protein